ncbi:hypothetical protein [Halalkalibacillus sediminis]|uniref:hypothetical protein n=1 Tax=Halalkalibacillus sediminis TaxID=2018042 RepID=UPI0013902B1F|nr:hypothetical protein [Halalkalibacillus sediminis]
MLLLLLIILGMSIGYALSFIDPNGIVPALLGGILVVITYIAIQIIPKNRDRSNR